ncbi:hypothetical protein K0B96_05245 [Horticoccus luteus]|uniref:Tetratricopeptide repeat protein n=1 Tax=Horticoccus luteus TaxID=2862869 RepID=A0A8F9TVS2_9BACT|nr:hypothetical protein [Horticoccus luteus]QYM80026.1 hypothetical protein K0B96_05245 [Horticoccus luteus]
MFPLVPKTLLLALGLPVAALACGPYFPDTIINQGDAGLLSTPSLRFESALARAALPKPEFTASPPASDDTSSSDVLTAELQDLAATGASPAVLRRYTARRMEMFQHRDRAWSPLWSTADPEHPFAELPREFSLYLDGALAFHEGRARDAREAFLAVLALPVKQRPFKTVWAAFMLGRLAAAAGERSEALARFAQTREFVRQGFIDRAGLAAASLGEEAKVHFLAAEWLPAARLYLAHYASGHPSALNSLRFTAAAALADRSPAVLANFAADPATRGLITASLLECGRSVCSTSQAGPLNGDPDSDGAHRWLGALENAHVASATEASRFALTAYNAADYTACARWLALAPADAPDARWLRAKLALRDGRIDQATALLAALVHEDARVFDDAAGTRTLAGEFATLCVARRDYTEALRLLLHAGYWEDAAYIAERVLTLDELVAFVSALPSPANSSGDADFTSSLHSLLGRRLVRVDRFAEARAYLSPDCARELAQFELALAAGHDSARPATARGLALWRAATILRTHGLELRGTELAPDFAIWDGNFNGESFLATRNAAGGASLPSDDEAARALASDTRPQRRYHYRYRAADLAWEAAQLLPDNSAELAALLEEAGGWLNARDPLAADRFYKALVTRCADTDAGREARRNHWFPRT